MIMCLSVIRDRCPIFHIPAASLRHTKALICHDESWIMSTHTKFRH